MVKGPDGHGYSRLEKTDPAESHEASRYVFGGFWLILFVSTFFVSGPWAGFHGVLLGSVGLLMLFRPPAVRLPRSWWILAGLFLLAGSASFLPAKWFPMPEWRGKLEEVGLDTGPLVVIQAKHAAESFALFAITLFTGLWIAGHRANASQLRTWSMAFTVGVAFYAVVSRLVHDSTGGGVYGFFPNRNHTATYLAMGSVCGLGNILQALRDRRFFALALALVSTGICLWAVAGWSISRGGVVLVVVGALIWVSLLGRRYLGKHGVWAVALVFLASVGMFLVTDSAVKKRLSSTVEKTGILVSPNEGASLAGSPPLPSVNDLDFRIPTALDSLDLIQDFAWSGIGGGQFYRIFPQYKRRTSGAEYLDSFHPESDWLWIAAESGVPAAAAILALVVVALTRSAGETRKGRDRALRGACLVGAMIVPIHGMFDVPGHRIPLAWSATFLFALSLRNKNLENLRWSLRGWTCPVSVAILVAGIFLARSEWFGGALPATVVPGEALDSARLLYEKDKLLQAASVKAGLTYQPDTDEDNLEIAIETLENARIVAPLDRDILRYQAFLAFHFDDKNDLIDRVFELDRELDPTWVGGPLRQAEAWAPLDPKRTLELWLEALRRAEKVDRLVAGDGKIVHQTMGRIRKVAITKAELANFLRVVEDDYRSRIGGR